MVRDCCVVEAVLIALGALVRLWKDGFRVPPPNVGHTVVSTGMCESIVEKSFADLDSKGWGRCSPDDVIA
jgi:hypothetical protein